MTVSKNRNTICLVMICKNEEDFIIPALESVEKWIDYYVVVDSDSADDTVFLIDTWMKGTGIPGDVLQYPFPFHAGEKRTWALQQAAGKADYLFMMDADCILQVDGDPFHDLTESCYYLMKQHDGLQYLGAYLFRGDLQWCYTGIAHEYPELVGGIFAPAPAIPGVIVHESSKAPGSPRERKPLYYYDLALMMERELLDKRDQLPDHLKCRYAFYIGMGYKDANEWGRAIRCFEARIQMPGGYWEEIFYSLYMIAKIKQATAGVTAEVIDAYWAAWNYRPQRLEPAYVLMQIYSNAKMFNIARMIGEYICSHNEPVTDMLFLEKEIYDTKFLELYDSITQKETV